MHVPYTMPLWTSSCRRSLALIYMHSLCPPLFSLPLHNKCPIVFVCSSISLSFQRYIYIFFNCTTGLWGWTKLQITLCSTKSSWRVPVVNYNYESLPESVFRPSSYPRSIATARSSSNPTRSLLRPRPIFCGCPHMK
jgi:hypothetical protein